MFLKATTNDSFEPISCNPRPSNIKKSDEIMYRSCNSYSFEYTLILTFLNSILNFEYSELNLDVLSDPENTEVRN